MLERYVEKKSVRKRMNKKVHWMSFLYAMAKLAV